MKKTFEIILYILLGGLLLIKIAGTLDLFITNPKFASSCKSLNGQTLDWDKIQALKGYVLRENNNKYFLGRMYGDYPAFYFGVHEECKDVISDPSKFESCTKKIRTHDRPVLTTPNEIHVYKDKQVGGQWVCLIKHEGDIMKTSIYQTIFLK